MHKPNVPTTIYADPDLNDEYTAGAWLAAQQANTRATRAVCGMYVLAGLMFLREYLPWVF